MPELTIDSLNLKIVLILAVGLSFAALLGYLAHRVRLSPIFGYLIAGYCIGPYSPGFVADFDIASQLAEIGVVLMMFGVGLHFKWQDLFKVRNIAIPGAVGQTLVATLLGAALICAMGFSLETGILFGIAIGVASTMVLARVLSDYSLLKTPGGHASVGWLIVEDIITVLVLLLVPTIGAISDGNGLSFKQISWPIGCFLIKFVVLVVLVFTFGSRLITFILTRVMRKGSQELFTLTTLAIAFAIAVGSAFLFGTSLALGAFIAGMLISQPKVRSLVSTNSTPLRDAFVVVFFLSVGMLFNPFAVFRHFYAFIGVLAIILIAKPLTAFFITVVLKKPIKTALTVAVGLAQIGEFSFILSEEAMRFNLMPALAYDILVACALVSISINPLLFKLMMQNRRFST